jgi:hypothetical protein
MAGRGRDGGSGRRWSCHRDAFFLSGLGWHLNCYGQVSRRLAPGREPGPFGTKMTCGGHGGCCGAVPGVSGTGAAGLPGWLVSPVLAGGGGGEPGAVVLLG